MSTAFLSALDPTLLTGARNALAQGLSTRIASVLPDVMAFLDAGGSGKLPADARQRMAAALRELEHQASRFGAALADGVATRFGGRLSRLSGKGALPASLTLDSLSLVRDEQVEEDITIGHCVKRLRDQSDYELFALTQRIALLVGRDRLDDSVNPVAPAVLAESLMAALAPFADNPETRLALFKAFGPVLLDVVPEVYAAANAFLAERGIELPVEGPYGRPVITPERPFSALPSPALAQVRFAEPVTRELLDSLAGVLGAAAAGARAPLRKLSSTDPNATTSTRLLHQARAELQAQSQSEEAIVADLITVVFDRLFADRRIAPALMPVLARLQVPVLEIALHDPTLFSNPDHGVKKLIDLLVEFGMTVDATATHGSAGIQSVAAVIEGLVRDHATVPDAFTEGCRQLDALLYHHEEAALHRDQWLMNLLAAEEREAALLAANVAISQRLAGREPTALSRAFIQVVWRDVLVRDHLSGGERGEAWKLGLATLDELLKCLTPARTDAEQDERLRALPSLMALLREGMAGVDADQVLCNHFFEDLRHVNLSGHHDEAPPNPATGSGMVYSLARRAAAAKHPPPVSPAAELDRLGLACGSWIEFRHGGDEVERWRLNWVTPGKGSLVLRHYETGSVRSLSLAEMKRRIVAGEAVVVKSVGIANAVFAEAFKVMARKSRRDNARPAQRGQAAAREAA